MQYRNVGRKCYVCVLQSTAVLEILDIKMTLRRGDHDV